MLQVHTIYNVNMTAVFWLPYLGCRHVGLYRKNTYIFKNRGTDTDDLLKVCVNSDCLIHSYSMIKRALEKCDWGKFFIMMNL